MQVNNSPNGGTAINNTSSFGLELQYSLDNINFQNSNLFNGLDVGSFTFMLKINLVGLFQNHLQLMNSDFISLICIYQKQFYSFLKQNTWGDAANYKKVRNTLGAGLMLN
jgi:hypothetical protein